MDELIDERLEERLWLEALDDAEEEYFLGEDDGFEL